MNRHFLFIPHLKIHNANAMSSPFTIGFPAMTAWLGSVHALERRLHDKGHSQISLVKMAVSCHHFDLQTYKGKGDYVHSIVGTANPLDKDGSRPAFIEEARCHLEISLLIELENYSVRKKELLLQDVNQTIMQMKVASGDIQSVWRSEILSFNEDSESAEQSQRRIMHKLMLGNVLIERRDLMIQSMEEGKDAIDALLDYVKVNHNPIEETKENDKVDWKTSKKSTDLNSDKAGWIVPIAVGFQGISPLSEEKVLNQRDDETPHRFAESMVTLGEFIMPYRAESIDDILWEYHVDLDKDLYVCRNQMEEL